MLVVGGVLVITYNTLHLLFAHPLLKYVVLFWAFTTPNLILIVLYHIGIVSSNWQLQIMKVFISVFKIKVVTKKILIGHTKDSLLSSDYMGPPKSW